MIATRRLVVVGNGMVGHRFCEMLVERGLSAMWEVTVLGEEPRAAYDRVHLSGMFEGKTPEDLSLLSSAGWYAANGLRLVCNAKASAIDRARQVVTTTDGGEHAYDLLVLATGSSPFVPPVPGREGGGSFVYRTIEDCDAIRAWAAGCTAGAVIGGGLLGLEAANALRLMGLAVTVVEFAPRLMAVQVDDAGGALLRRKIEALGVTVKTSTETKEIVRGADGRPEALRFADGSTIPAQLVLFSAGVRPRDELAKAAGLPLGARGGVVIDDACVTADAKILAIGECAAWQGRTYGLVAPGYHMARVAVERIAAVDAPTTITGFDMSTKLKLMGVEVASFGDAMGQTPGSHAVSYSNSPAGIYKKLVLSADRTRLIGGILVGDASSYGGLHQAMLNNIAMPAEPESLILPATNGKPAGLGVDSLPDAAGICSCHNVSKGSICTAINDGKLTDVAAIKSCTKAGTGCGSCVPLLKDLLKYELKKSGIVVNNHLCAHFAFSRQELHHLVRVHRIRSFEALIAAHGTGHGCEICKPAVASILASCWNDHVLGARRAALQDTNDRYLGNMQRDGTYSVVPRVPAGEITPDQLIVLGRVAKKYTLYSKITGGQRVDLFGARVEQLPAIWEELIAAGFESGHAYGKSLRTVKSCVGTTWCRYGVQDSVALAIKLEHRYKGLRSPHKLKSACSGCARECAEAQSKDFGIIATERGYNLHVCGNGGMKPQHGALLAVDLTEEQVLRYCDRFLMFYIRTADRLERTATWFNKLEGGLDYLRAVVIDDKLGIAAELEADMQAVVDAYQDEWRTAVEDPDLRRHFRAFVNSDAPDPTIVMIPERGQHRPAYWEEKVERVAALVC